MYITTLLFKKKRTMFVVTHYYLKYNFHTTNSTDVQYIMVNDYSTVSI